MAKLLLFGRLAEVAGWREREVVLPASLLMLRSQLTLEDPALGEALAGAGVLAAVDQVLTRGDAPLLGVVEVAFLPPLSGG
ncbi:MAG: MoaD/ThiS family protein [Alphaproteobacteria bacterium]|jgi:molybdopterin synthase sulfur carrier subunit